VDTAIQCSGSPETTQNDCKQASTTSSPISKLADLDADLDKYEGTLRVPLFQFADNDGEAERLLNLPASLLKKMNAVELGEAAVVLKQFAYNLQKAVNAEQARLRACDETIRKLVARQSPKYKGISYDERKTQAILDDPKAQEWDRQRVRSQLRLDRISFLSAKAEGLANAMMGLQQTKRGKHD
jgi:hypothetical protein